MEAEESTFFSLWDIADCMTYDNFCFLFSRLCIIGMKSPFFPAFLGDYMVFLLLTTFSSGGVYLGSLLYHCAIALWDHILFYFEAMRLTGNLAKCRSFFPTNTLTID